MKYVMIAIVLMGVLVAGCNECNIRNVDGCDKSCGSDDDCTWTCGAGCINKDEEFDIRGVLLNCPDFLMTCKCIDGVCQKYTAESIREMTPELCESAGGNWNECSNKCQIDNQGKEGIACTMQCEALCECGGMAGYTCPEGYNCRLPEGIADALGYCIWKSKMSLGEALEIAKNSECTQQGALTENAFYNENTRTWWIDLELEKQGCAPACVVSDETMTAEINWRCTGALV